MSLLPQRTTAATLTSSYTLTDSLRVPSLSSLLNLSAGLASLGRAY